MGRMTAVLLLLAGTAAAAPVDGAALRRGADALAALRGGEDGATLSRLAEDLRAAGAEVDGPAPDHPRILARIDGRDERLRTEAVLVVVRSDGDVEAAATLPFLARALAGREGLPRRTVLLLAAPADRVEDFLPAVQRARGETIVVVVDVESLEGSAGRPGARCETTDDLRLTLLRARRKPDIFLWLTRRAPDAGPTGGAQHLVIREPADGSFTTSGPPSEGSLGRVADFAIDTVRTLADAEEEPPLGLAAPLEASAAAMLERASRLAATRRYTEALGIAARALAEHPDAHQVRLFRARVLLELNRPDAARAEAEAVLRERKDDPDAWLLRGRAAEAAGDEDRAFADYEAVLAHRPDDVEAHARRGLLRVRRGLVDPAMEDFQAALQKAPNHPIALKGQGLAWFYRREYARALDSLDRATRRDQDDWESWFYRGLVRLYRGSATTLEAEDVERSLADFTSAITSDPREPLPYLYRGDIYLGRDEYEKARADYDAAIRLRPEDSHLHFQRGLANLSLDRFAPAIEDFERVIALDPGEPAAPYNIACAHARAGRPAEAMAWLEKSVAAGFLNDPASLEHMRTDPDLESIRELPAFRRLLRANRAD